MLQGLCMTQAQKQTMKIAEVFQDPRAHKTVVMFDQGMVKALYTYTEDSLG